MAEAFVVAATVVAVSVSDSLSSEDGIVSGSVFLSVALELSDEAAVEVSVVSELTDVLLKAVVTDGSVDALHEAMTKRRHISADMAAGLITDLLMLLLSMMKDICILTNKSIIPSQKICRFSTLCAERVVYSTYP